MNAVRMLDVLLVLVTAPVVAIAGAPALGVLVGAAAWIVQRFAALAIEARAKQVENVRSAVTMNLAGAFGRAWIVGLAILLVGTLGSRGRPRRRRARARGLHRLSRDVAGDALVIPEVGCRMKSMSNRSRVIIGLGLYVTLIVLFVIVFGAGAKNETFQPQNEFRLDTLFSIGPLDVHKAHLYVLAAGIFMTWSMLYVAKRMQEKPNKVQTAVEMVYGLMRDNITRGNMDDKQSARWFPFIAALFLFIWFSNMIGYLPLPTNLEHKVDVFGMEIPGFALYAATANLSIPLVLAIVVFLVFTAVGLKEKGLVGYLKSFIPAGVPGWLKPLIFPLELMSNFMRLISISVRLFANILAGHLIILFMGGALAILLGVAAVGAVTFPLAVVLFMFEVGLVATLQAFIFATLTAIYIGGAAADAH